jgi:hypothetical protein
MPQIHGYATLVTSLQSLLVHPSNLSLPKMDGYHKLAALVGDHEELFMLRRFATTNAKNLLYMQAEILHLDAELHEIATQDHSRCEKSRNYEYCVFDLKESYGNRENDTQWRKILEIREKLKEYSWSTWITQSNGSLNSSANIWMQSTCR